ncbi:MAG: hypothetical protein MPN21_01420 [Thermoanaerobaculia bacterium]|nr:hypothetical protein [Thermoanaerobaculia bacterium]
MKRRARFLLLATGVFLGLLSAASVPLRFDHANSGRYLLPVLQAADAELFPSDPVVESLERFRSLFYRSMAWWVHRSDLDPDGVESLFLGLYWISRVLLVLSVMALARALDSEIWSALFLGLWACFTVSVPVGGQSLFLNVVTHGTLALLLGMWSLWALFCNRRIAFWLLASLMVFVHPLMAVNLLLAIGPAQVILHRRIDRVDFVGGSIFFLSLVAYSTGVPPFTEHEATIFLAAKGGMKHVSLGAHGLLDWLEGFALLALALGTWIHGRQVAPSRNHDLLAAAIVCGSIAACALSLIATSLPAVRLLQAQPLRAFAWTHLLCFLLLAAGTPRLIRERAAAALPLTLYLALSLVPTLWQIPFAFLALAALWWPRWRRLWMITTGGLAATVVVGWLMQDTWPGFETLQPPMVPALAMVVVATWAVAGHVQPRARSAIIVVALLAAAGSSALSWHRYYDGRDDPEWGSSFDDRVHEDWTTARRWIAAHTSKAERILVAGGEGNFRTIALRTAVGESMSALAWVDPSTYQDLAEGAARVRACHMPEGWALDCLLELAAEEDTSHLVVEGSVRGVTATPLAEFGDYRVFRATAGTDSTTQPLPDR